MYHLDFDKEKGLFNSNRKLEKVVLKVLRSNLKMDTPKDGIVCFILAKSYKTYKAALILTKKGYSEDSDMLVRTLFDAYIIIASVLADISDSTAMKFYSFDYVTRDRMFSKIKNRPSFQKIFENRKENPLATDETVEEIHNYAQEWRDKHKNPQRWHSPSTLGELAENTGVKQYFDTAYELQSQLVHSLPRTMNRYIFLKNNKYSIDISPKVKYTDLSLVSAFNMMFAILEQVNKHYTLRIEKELEEAALEFEKSVADYSKLTN